MRLQLSRQMTLTGLVGILVLLAFTSLYFSTRTEVHTFDALSYTRDVETKPFGQLYHPHHLLYGPLGRLTFELAKNLGYEGRADQPVQFVNALAGASGVVLLWLFGRRFTGKNWQPLGVAVLVGMCYAYWLYAAEVEVYTLAAMFITLALWILTRLEEHPREVIFLALATAGAVMFHQTNLMFAAPVGLFLLMDTQLRKFLLLYGLVLAGAVALPYLAVGWNSGFRDFDAYYHWLTDYAQTDQWGGNLNFDTLDALRAGLRNTVSPENDTLVVLFYALAGTGLLTALRTQKKNWLVFGFSWLILYGGFFWWWEPWNIEFWIVLLPLWAMWMLAGNRAIISLAAGLLAIFLFRAHYTPLREAADAQKDYYQQITQTLAPQLRQTDLVVTRGNILDLYLPFYANHPPSFVVSLREISLGGGNKLDTLMNRITPAYHYGRLIFIDQMVLDEPMNEQRNPFGLTAEDITTFKERFPIQKNVTYNGSTVFYSIGKRTAPDENSWSFENELQGWAAFGLDNARFENGGWCFTGGGDPWIESPEVQVNAANYPRIQIDLEIQSPAKEGQVFWMQQGEGLSEDRSLRFPLTTGRKTYTLELTGQKGWEGTIVFLRLDPIPENLDVTACVYSIQLMDEFRKN